MNVQMEYIILLALFSVYHKSVYAFYCAPFRPFRTSIDEATQEGRVLATFEHPASNKTTLAFTEGATEFLEFDNVNMQLKAKTGIASQRGKTLMLKGKCSEYLETLKFNLDVPALIEVKVEDLNDPPVIRNLPATTNVEESTTANSVVFVVDADNPEDVFSLYTFKIFQILNVTAYRNGNEEPLDGMFVIDDLGRVRVSGKLDFEEGPRKYKLTIQVQDAGSPPLKVGSTLTIFVNDSDDQGPKFSNKVYFASLVGEKTIIQQECQDTTPPLLAEDQDPVRKSPIRYTITDGFPKEPWHFGTFLQINADTGQLCQRETIPRMSPKSGDLHGGFVNYTLVIQAYQTEDRTKADIATLFVHVIDQNIHPPTFPNPTIRATMAEFPTLEVGHIVTTVKAYDNDYGKNSLFLYELSENPMGAFGVNSHTGEIRVVRPRVIDREKNQTIYIKVHAVETSSTDLLSSDPDATVQITITDVNDNPPRFETPLYVYEVKDNLKIGSSLSEYSQRLIAKDPDLGENGTVRYTIINLATASGISTLRDFQRFRIGAKNGVFFLSGTLTDLRRKRQMEEFRIMVKADDQSKDIKNRRSALAQVVIRVTEANEYPPVFEETHRTVFVSEAASVGTLMTKLKVRDKDGDEDIYVKFRIYSGNEDAVFRISDQGYLYTNQLLDREIKEEYLLTVAATDSIHTAEMKVTVIIKDINDHAPVFNQSVYDFYMPEDAQTGSTIGNVTAEDSDANENGRVDYSLEGEDADLFGIRGDGELYLKKKDSRVDAEKNDKFQLQVKAVDNGEKPLQGYTTVRVHLVDLNDNKPIFTRSHYITEITEESSGENVMNKLIVMENAIMAEDLDKNAENRNVQFSLAGHGSEIFLINETTGSLYVRETQLIDCETQCEYNIKLVAKDQGGQGLEGYAELFIQVKDINDNAPEFEEDYTFNVSLQTRVGSVIGAVKAVDRDTEAHNKRVIYVLNEGGYGKFRVDFDSGDIVLTDKLTRPPQEAEYILIIEAMDTGEPRQISRTEVKVTVPFNVAPKVDDNMTFEVDENTPLGSVVGIVDAVDPNPGERAFFEIINRTVPFVIDSDTGTITVNGALDRESTEKIMFLLKVFDNAVPSNTATTTITVIIQDVNDNPPQLSAKQYFGEITEDDLNPINSQIVKMSEEISSTDEDMSEKNQVVLYSLTGKQSELFVIDQTQGVIQVKHAGTIDKETVQTFHLKVHATNVNGTGLSDEADLRIDVKDVNDNAPSFLGQLPIHLDPFTKPGSVVTTIRATDRDTDPPNNVVLHLLSTGGFGKFSIEPFTGVITLIGSLLADPKQSDYNIEVEAFDFGNPQMSSNTTVVFRIPVNYPPEVKDIYSFTVLENVSVSEVVGQITAIDPNLERGENDELKFYISESRIKGDRPPFKIERGTGEIRTTSLLDRETVDKYTFLVFVTDSGKPVYTSSTTVLINLDDLNDSPPQFSSNTYAASVKEDDGNPEDVQILSFEPTMYVSDADWMYTPVVYSLQGEGSYLFEFDPSTGSIKQKTAGNLDSEMKSFYNLTMMASDGVMSGMATLLINVEDMNDNSPTFLYQLDLSVDPQTSVGSVIGQVNATDDDVTEANCDIRYYIIGGGLDKFNIDQETGEIILISPLDKEPMYEQYNIKIIATDRGTPPLSNETTVTVTVDVNYPPLLQDSYKFEVIENNNPGLIVGEIVAMDINVQRGEDDKLHFFINERDIQGKIFPFNLGRDSGMITVKSSLDREVKSQYEFTVFVTDSKKPVHTASASVVIDVKDVVDCPPQFNSDLYTAHVFEDDTTPSSIQILSLMPAMLVRDDDESSSSLTYSLHGPGSDLFEIAGDTEVIQQKIPGNLDSEFSQEYNITLTVSDGILSSNATLQVFIEDVNDHVPVFTSADYILINSNIHIGSAITQVKAFDQDVSEKNNKIKYYLMSGGMDKFFLDENSGNITLVSSLTKEPRLELYKLNIRAVDLGYPSMTSEISVQVEVPANFKPQVDNYHKFDIEENLPPGSTVGQIQATDRDVQDQLNYYILETDAKTLPFMIEKNSGNLITTSPIDKETTDSYKFTVCVTDNGKVVNTVSTTVTVTVADVNDNPPQFSAPSYTSHIYEDDHTSQAIRTLEIFPLLRADDIDEAGGSVVYSLEGDTEGHFQINNATGEVSQTVVGNLDSEQQTEYNLTVTASDGLYISSAHLTVFVEDLNDNTPSFKDDLAIHLDATPKPGTVVGKVAASDADVGEQNHAISYLMIRGSFGKFTVDDKSGEILTTDALLHETEVDEYNMTVRAVDFGSPQRTADTIVYITVPLNYPPIVPASHTFDVAEDVALTTSIGRINATDRNIEKGQDDKLNFFIDERVTVPFKIEHETGVVLSKATLDRETVDEYVFLVFVRDSGVPVYTSSSTVTVNIIDVNDNPPQFLSHIYTAHVREDDFMPGDVQQVNLYPALQVEDIDEVPSAITYSLEGPGCGLFEINSTSGQIWQKTAGTFDSEKQFSYNLTIIATDGLLQSEALLYVIVEDENDNAPKITELDFNVKPDTPTNEVVGRIQAVDADVSERNGKVRYYLLGGGLDKFSVNVDTGEIILQSSLLEEPKLGRYDLSIQAVDSGTPQKSDQQTVYLEVPINFPPNLNDSYEFNILENVPVSYQIGKISAVDWNVENGQDDKLSYFIDEKSKGDEFPFDIDVSTGMIFLINSVDREDWDAYIFSVFVKDSGQPSLTSSASITITLDDVNDNPPTFSSPLYTAHVSEDHFQPADIQVLYLTPELDVSDHDITENDVDDAYIEFSLSGDGSDLFEIDSATWQIAQRKPGSFDAEKQQIFNLTLLATDGLLSSTVNLNVVVDDINDYAPVFDNVSDYMVDANSKIGTVVVQLNASDGDISKQNSDISYFLMGGGLDKFSVHSRSGEITVSSSLTDEPRQGIYNLKIRAVDHGIPQQSTDTVVSVTVDINVAPILKEQFEFVVYENVSIGEEIGQIVATDWNIENGEKDSLEYYIDKRFMRSDFPFQIDCYNGTISTTDLLDREDVSDYSFRVFVTDSGTPKYTSSSSVLITVRDINDNPPTFTSQTYTARVSEDNGDETRPQTIVLKPDIVVEDADEAISTVLFSLQGNNTELFIIDQQTGTITQNVSGSLDAEIQQQYHLLLTVSDGFLSSNADLDVIVDDINDNSPVFDTVTDITVDQKADIGSLVGQVVATDADVSERNNLISYYIIRGSLDKFGINQTTGEIRVQTSLTTEPIREKYQLKIQAVDGGIPQRSALSTVLVTVLLPETAETVEFLIDEGVATGTEIGNITVTEDGNIHKYRYQIHERNAGGKKLPFVVERKVGVIKTLLPIDREDVSEYNFTVAITDKVNPDVNYTVNVVISVSDVNDSPPEFKSHLYTARLTEDHSMPGEARVLNTVPTLLAFDPDTYGFTVTYSMTGDGSELFVIDPDTGIIKQKVAGSLDSERDQEYNITIIASDGFLSSNTTLHVLIMDENDNSPVIASPDRIVVDPSTPAGRVVGRVNGSDDDVIDMNSCISYYLITGGLDRFAVHQATGDIKVLSSLLDEPVRDEYNLTIKAIDSGFPQLSTTATVQIDVPLNYPPIVDEIFQFDVTENVPLETWVGQVVAEDRNIDKGDVDELHYFISQADKAGNLLPFSLNETTGVIVTSSAVDQEMRPMYSFTVFVSDTKTPVYTSSTQVVVTVEDVNDNPPQFIAPSFKAIAIEDNANPDQFNPILVLPEILHMDEDSVPSPVTYILEGEGSDLFELNPQTGEITQRTPGSLDSEIHSEYNLIITVTDGLLESKVPFTISVEDVNDNSPVFSDNYNFTIDSDTAVGSVIGKVTANDADITETNNLVTYSLIGGGLDKFNIDRDSGDISLVSSLTVEPIQDIYYLNIMASDLGNPPMSVNTVVNVTVPINSAPVLDMQYVFHILENVTSGEVVGKVEARDDDIGQGGNDTLKYCINEQDKTGIPFKMEINTGVITVSAELDREVREQYIFEIYVSDSGQPVLTSSSTVTVTVMDVNDNPPQLQSDLYTAHVNEDDEEYLDIQTLKLSPSLSVTDMDASDLPVYYSISGAGSELFQIDASTGVIRQAEPGNLDAETESSYNITITASDSKLSFSSNLSIFVDDVNDNSPVFSHDLHLKVNPKTKTDTVVGQVIADDDDLTKVNSDITYYLLGGGLDKFSINQKTGNITLTTSLIDEPRRDFYCLKIRASDSGSPQRHADTIVNITVPITLHLELKNLYVFEILENATVPTVIGSVREVQEGNNSTLRYFINERDKQGKFPFEIESGVIVTTTDLDRETSDVYSFLVFVVDSSPPHETVSTTVTVNILDVNDNPPVFNSPVYTAHLTEDHSNPGAIQTLVTFPPISVLDVDESNIAITYNISGLLSELFVIDHHTGEIRQMDAGSMDSEREMDYNVTLMVTDGVFTSSAALHIVVDDVNDNAPMFTDQYDIEVNPTSPIGSVVGQVFANDSDVSERNGKVAYYLIRGGLDRFSVDSQTGVISVVESLINPPYTSNYQLYIQASDFGQPQHTDETVVNITVPLNKEPFVSVQTVFSVKENETIGTEIGMITVSDPDGTAGLSFIIDDSKVPFEIDSVTGSVRICSPLDYENTEWYTFPVLIYDDGLPRHTVTTMTTVYIENVNDESPQFSAPFYTATIDENISEEEALKPINIVPKLTVDDPEDKVGLDSLMLTLMGSGSELFIINSTTMQIFLSNASMLDCEHISQYFLQIIATDEGGLGLENSANLTVTVSDYNDCSPEFSQQYNFSVLQGAQGGYSVGRVLAVDLDSGEANNRVTYILKNGGAGKFLIDPESGEILTSSSLYEHPVHDVYTLSIQARDSGHPSLVDETVVSVTVVNNQPPVVSEINRVFVLENVSVSSVIANFSVEDDDMKLLTFTLLDHTDIFTIDNITGEIHTVVSLDAEDETEYHVRIEILDAGLPSFTVTSFITVSILNVNDKYPEFSSPQGYQATVEEQDTTNDDVIIDVVPQIRVKDDDVNQTAIVYSLKGNNSDHFAINMSTGQIIVAPRTSLDCENIQEYNLKILATDDGGTGLQSESSLRVFVSDVNDNAPVVDQDIMFEVHPSAAVGDVVGRIMANDSDHSTQNSRITYLLQDGGYGKFSLDYDEGIIYVADSLLREPYIENYTLTVRVKDSGVPSLSSDANITIIVPINKPPVITPQHTFKVQENMAGGTFIGDVSVEDPDGSAGTSVVSYTLEGHQGLFTIDTSTGIITTLSEIDAEETEWVDMTVQVVDKGLPTYRGTSSVHVNIVGINDNAPEFSSQSGYTAELFEDVALKTGKVKLKLIPELIVTDNDGDEITYTMEGDGLDLFTIDQLSGQIVLTKPGGIDADVKDVYNLQIIAKDEDGLSNRSNVTVTVVDLNDNGPVFENNYTFTAAPDEKIGTVLGSVAAIDKDVSALNSQMQYTLKTGGYDKFSVDPTTGELSIMDILLCEPQKSVYKLVIEAQDSGYPPLSSVTTVEVTVPVNNPPATPHHTVFNISETFAIGHVIGYINASDVDVGSVDSKQYLSFILHDDNKNPFMVDEKSGELTLGNVLDADTVSTYSMMVTVEDHGLPSLTSTTTLVVNVEDVNDHPPRFNSDSGYTATLLEYSVSANASEMNILKLVPELSVFDDDVTSNASDIRFTLKGDDAAQFTVDAVSGEITVTADTSLDSDTKNRYILELVAEDEYGAGLSAVSTVEVYIEDLNDNAPVFNQTYIFKAAASAVVGTEIGQVMATDDDNSLQNSAVLYFIQNGGYGKFSVDSQTGLISISSSLAREPIEDMYELNITAVDLGNPPLSSQTTVQVLVDNNRPPVIPLNLNFHVFENASIGESVGMVPLGNATSDDLNFKMAVPNDYFNIDNATGDIIIVSLLDAESKYHHSFDIIVTNNGIPPLSTRSTVTMEIGDVNDNPPQFPVTTYRADLTEGQVQDNQLIKLNPGISAKDPDVTGNSSAIQFSISGNGSDNFIIDTYSGEVRLKDAVRIDSETQNLYNLQVTAVDEGNLTAMADLEIVINDVNEHAPIFTTNVTDITVDPLTALGIVVAGVHADDADSTSFNNRITYILQRGGYDVFNIDPLSGNIIVANYLTEEPYRKDYKLVVKAIDSGIPQLSSETVVSIKVPLNTKLVLDSSMEVQVSENVSIGHIIGHVMVNDSDSDLSDLTFKFLSNISEFSIGYSSGEIRTEVLLDAERRQQYIVPVLVTDIGVPTYTTTTSVTVIITDVDDNLPVFSSSSGYTSVIEEGSYLSGHKLSLIPSLEVKDLDVLKENHDFHLYLSGNGSSHFVLDSLDKTLYLQNMTILDAENISQYDLTIVAESIHNPSEYAEASLVITVSDVNDNAPVFAENITFIVNPSAVVGDKVGNVTAIDNDDTQPNNKLIYFIRDDGYGKFRIDHDTGEVFIKTNLTAEPLQENFELIVEAMDLGFPPTTASTTVLVNVALNKPPTMPSSLSFNVTEDVFPGSCIGQIVVDNPDTQSSIWFQLLETDVPFGIDVSDGSIKTSSELDTETTDKYMLQVVVVDRGIPDFTSTIPVEICVQNVNDNPPEFTSLSGYHATMKENSDIKVIDVLPKVITTDADLPHDTQHRHVYSLEGPGSQFFNINPQNATITVKSDTGLDAEIQDVFSLQIIAQDENGIGLSSSADLKIMVEDENDNAPQFEKDYSLTVAADLTVGALVCEIWATDDDISPHNNRPLFILQDGFGKFRIDPINGNIFLTSKLTQEPFEESYLLPVSVVDSGYPPLSARTAVLVNVSLNQPPVLQTLQTFTVMENAVVDDVIGTIQVVDPDGSGYIDIQMVDSIVPFSIANNTGVISVKSALDRELGSVVKFLVEVRDVGSPTFTSTVSVTVDIEDVNDNPPQFNVQDGYVGHIPEKYDSLKPYPVEIKPPIKVTDKDTAAVNGDTVLELMGLGSVLFTVDQKTGQVTLAEPDKVDREKYSAFNMTLTATDQGGKGLKSSVSLVLHIDDFNDNAPQFPGVYNFSITTNVAPATCIGTVKALDADSTLENNKITYILKSGGYGKFEVDPDEGKILISDDISREPVLGTYHLVIQALDSGQPRLFDKTNVTIHIPVNSPPKVKDTYKFKIAENETVGTVVGEIEIDDPDIGINLFEKHIIEVMDPLVPFTFFNDSQKLITTQLLDRESDENYVVHIRVVNAGSPSFTVFTTVTVLIEDINDNMPSFNSPGGYIANIQEHGHNDVIKLVPKVEVTDKDATDINRHVVLHLSGNGSQYFYYNESSGDIQVINSEDIDCEVKCNYSMTLTATDCGGSGFSVSTNLTIIVEDINDNAPRFMQNYTFDVFASVQIGYSVGNISAVDLDSSEQNNRVTYILLRGGFGKFFIHPDSGEITTTDSLIHEPPIEKFDLEVEALDNGIPRQTALTIVEINVAVNHPPSMSLQLEFNLDENVVNGTDVGTVTANDTDIGVDGRQNLTFYMEDYTVPFTITAETGLIQTVGDIDRESDEKFSFPVFVKDNGIPRYTASSVVVVHVSDLNDNAPILSGGEFYLGTVKENYVWSNGSQIVQMGQNITVVDLDATLENRQVELMLDGLGSDKFYLDNTTGTVHVAKPGTLDRELIETYHLTILAVDQGGKGLTSSATLKIEVEDVNDNFPEFVQSDYTFTLPSVAVAGDLVGSVVAHDDDAIEPNNQIIYLLKNDTLGKFNLDVNTGDLILLEGFFSKPRKDVYILTVEARDMGFPPRKSCTKVTVNAPYFDYNDYPPDIVGDTSFLIKEEIPIGSVIGNLTVIDKDKDNTTENIVHLQLITEEKDPVPFKIMPDGSIITTGKIDRDSKTSGKRYFNFKVQATDKGTPPFNITRDINVIIDDINDNPPKFTRRKYEHMISDGFPTRTVIATPFAFDNTDESDSAYEYSIVGGKPGVIHIDKKTGSVITTDKARTLKPQVLNYRVMAVDLQNKSLFAEAKLKITVIESKKLKPCK